MIDLLGISFLMALALVLAIVVALIVVLLLMTSEETTPSASGPKRGDRQ